MKTKAMKGDEIATAAPRRVTQEVFPPECGAAGHLSERAETVMSWGASLLLHAGLGMLLTFAVFAVTSVRPTEAENQIFLPPVNDGFDNGRLSPILNVGTGDDMYKPPAQDQVQHMLKGWDPKGRLDSVERSFAGADAREKALEILRGNGVGTGGLGENGKGTGLPGMMAPYGPPSDGGLFGQRIGPTALRIVYVLDHSGSMMDNFDYLRQETEKRVNLLSPVQQFSVIVFSEDVEVLGPAGLQRALPQAKRDLMARLDRVVPQGQNDDMLDPFLSAMGKAFALKPEVIIFLTDGRFDERLMAEVAKLNVGKAVRINTIAFVNHDAQYEALLDKMAKQNGGTFKFVSERDLTPK